MNENENDWPKLLNVAIDTFAKSTTRPQNELGVLFLSLSNNLAIHPEVRDVCAEAALWCKKDGSLPESLKRVDILLKLKSRAF